MFNFLGTNCWKNIPGLQRNIKSLDFGLPKIGHYFFTKLSHFAFLIFLSPRRVCALSLPLSCLCQGQISADRTLSEVMMDTGLEFFVVCFSGSLLSWRSSLQEQRTRATKQKWSKVTNVPLKFHTSKIDELLQDSLTSFLQTRAQCATFPQL